MYEINYQLTRADLAAYQKMATARLKAEANKNTSVWTKLALWIGLVVLFAVGFNVAGQTTIIDPVSVLVGVWIGLLLVSFLSMYTASRVRSAMYCDSGPSLSVQHAVFDETGMHVKTAKLSAAYNWDLFLDITSGTEQIILWLEPCLGFVIPRSAFNTPAAAGEFCTYARERIAAAAQPSAPAVTSPRTS